MVFYKIMNKDGLFSDGGENAYFSKKGKEWKEMRFLKSHITRIIQCENEDVYRDCFLCEFEFKEISKLSITPVIQEKKLKLIEKEKLEESRNQKWKEQEERKLLKELNERLRNRK